MQPESSDGFASVGTILPKEEAALLPGGFFASGGGFFSCWLDCGGEFAHDFKSALQRVEGHEKTSVADGSDVGSVVDEVELVHSI